MRIAVMFRSVDEEGGVGVYARNIVRELLDLDTHNHYILLHRTRDNLDCFADRPNVTARLLRAPGKALWDQVAVPWACWQERADVVFHPKFTVPFLAPCPSVMVVHGADWFMPGQAEFYGRRDVAYIRAVMPWYFRRAARVLSVSQLTTDNFNTVLQLPPQKVLTTYFAPARHFQRIEDPAELQRVRTQHGLPERFILTLTKRSGGGRKNLGNLFKAYALYHERTPSPLPLVVGGRDCHLFAAEHGLPGTAHGEDVIFPSWLDQADLPAIYSQAALYLYPSNLEAFPIPLTEAMACGTPIVTSDANGLEEIAGDAALRVDPESPAEIAQAMERVLSDETLAAELQARGLERSKLFSWDRCARQTLDALEAAASGRGAVTSSAG